MEPGEDYEFDGEYVTEYPVAQKGKRVPIVVSDPKDPRLKAYQDSLALYNRSNQARVDALLRQGFKYDTKNNKKQNYLYTEKEKRDYQQSMGVNPNKGLQKMIQSGNDGRIDQSVGGQYDKKAQYELTHGKIAPIGIAPLYDSWWRTSPTLTLENNRPNPNYGKPFAKDFEGKVIRNFFSVPLYKEPVQPVEYRKPEDRRDTLYVSDLKHPMLKAHQDSLRLHNLSMEAVNPKYYNRNPSDPLGVTTPSSRWFKDKENNAAVNAFIKKYGLLGSRDPLPKGIQPIDYFQWSEGLRLPFYKKPVQPVVYRPEPEYKPRPKVEAELPRTSTGDLSYNLPKAPAQPSKTKKITTQKDEPERTKKTPVKDFLEDMRLRMEDRKMERKTKRGIKSQLKCFSGVCYDNEGNIVQAKDGVSVNNADAQPLKKLDQLLNFTNYNKPTKGGWLDKYN
jgi:hypothetical protein